jgi:prepilin-type N-terminal cleavage/methylation domain-containing protein
MPRDCHSNQTSAFTLIELLVVIAIIAILAAILFPVFARAKESANGSVALSRINQIGLGTALYMSDSDDIFPLTAYATTTGFVTWRELVNAYVNNVTVWYCPESTVRLVDSYGAPTTHWGYNASYLTTILFDFSNANGHSGLPFSAVNSPASTVIFTSSKASIPTSYCGNDGKYLLAPSDANADCWGRSDPTILNEATVAWCDTHVNRRGLTQFYLNQTPPDRFFSLN